MGCRRRLDERIKLSSRPDLLQQSSPPSKLLIRHFRKIYCIRLNKTFVSTSYTQQSSPLALTYAPGADLIGFDRNIRL